MKHNYLLFFALILFSFLSTKRVKAQACVSNPSNVYTFINGLSTYEVIKEGKTWTAAQSCATNRGGSLAVIGSQQEQDTIFKYVNLAGVNLASTRAPDGGNASYVWIGGNDRTTEGSWEWENGTAPTIPFWLGARNGSAVNGNYNNWGNEPDNFNNQDALGFALSSWPFGVAGEWNDVDESNSLYFIVEIANGLSTVEIKKENQLTIFPNPANQQLQLNFEGTEDADRIQLINLFGQVLIDHISPKEKSLDISKLSQGIYFIQYKDRSLKFIKQ